MEVVYVAASLCVSVLEILFRQTDSETERQRSQVMLISEEHRWALSVVLKAVGTHEMNANMIEYSFVYI